MTPFNYFNHLDFGDVMIQIAPARAENYHFAGVTFNVDNTLYVVHSGNMLDLGRDLHYNPPPVMAPGTGTLVAMLMGSLLIRRFRNR